MEHDLKEMLEMLERYRNRVVYNFHVRAWLNERGLSCEVELDRIKCCKAVLRRAFG